MSKNLLMITGLGSAKDLAQGKRGAFYNTLEEFHKYWDRIDIIISKVSGEVVTELFGNVYLHVSPWPLILHPLFFLKKGTSLHKKHHFDAITVQEFPPFYNGIGAFLLWCRIKVPYLLEIHHVPGYPKSANLKEWLYRFFMRLLIALDALPARAVRVVNKNQTKEFLIRAGVPESKIMHIPSLYIDQNIFHPTHELKECDIIFVGRLAENKGIKLFLNIAKISGLRALIVGDGPLKKYVNDKIKNWKLENVKCFGWAKDSNEIASLINKSKLLIMPSLNEGGPRVVVEAMACGVPVLATPVGIVPDFKEASTIIDWNVDDIVKKARHLLSDKQIYDSKVELGLEVAKQFNKESAVKNYAEEIKKLI